MEHEEGHKGLAEYVERWDGNGVLEVMAYSGVMKIKEEFFTYPNPTTKVPRYRRVLIIPLPPDFDWSKIDTPPNKSNLPNCIIIEEFRERWKRKVRKIIRPLYAFLDKPGITCVKKVEWSGRVGPKGMVWISEEKFKSITKRNLYVDKFYADQIFNRGKDNRGT